MVSGEVGNITRVKTTWYQWDKYAKIYFYSSSREMMGVLNIQNVLNSHAHQTLAGSTTRG